MPTQPEPVLDEAKLINLTLTDLQSGEIDIERAVVEIEYIVEQSFQAGQLAAAVQKERQRIMQEVVKWKLVIGANFFHQMAAKQLYELIEALTAGAEESNK